MVTVSLLARHLGCYKMTLDCKDKLIKFYETLGYVLVPGNANSMTIRYDGEPKINLTSAKTMNDFDNKQDYSNAACQTVSLEYNPDS